MLSLLQPSPLPSPAPPAYVHKKDRGLCEGPQRGHASPLRKAFQLLPFALFTKSKNSWTWSGGCLTPKPTTTSQHHALLLSWDRADLELLKSPSHGCPSAYLAAPVPWKFPGDMRSYSLSQPQLLASCHPISSGQRDLLQKPHQAVCLTEGPPSDFLWPSLLPTLPACISSGVPTGGPCALCPESHLGQVPFLNFRVVCFVSFTFESVSLPLNEGPFLTSRYLQMTPSPQTTARPTAISINMS